MRLDRHSDAMALFAIPLYHRCAILHSARCLGREFRVEYGGTADERTDSARCRLAEKVRRHARNDGRRLVRERLLRAKELNAVLRPFRR